MKNQGRVRGLPEPHIWTFVPQVRGIHSRCGTRSLSVLLQFVPPCPAFRMIVFISPRLSCCTVDPLIHLFALPHKRSNKPSPTTVDIQYRDLHDGSPRNSYGSSPSWSFGWVSILFTCRFVFVLMFCFLVAVSYLRDLVLHLSACLLARGRSFFCI